MPPPGRLNVAEGCLEGQQVCAALHADAVSGGGSLRYRIRGARLSGHVRGAGSGRRGGSVNAKTTPRLPLFLRLDPPPFPRSRADLSTTGKSRAATRISRRSADSSGTCRATMLRIAQLLCREALFPESIENARFDEIAKAQKQRAISFGMFGLPKRFAPLPVGHPAAQGGRRNVDQARRFSRRVDTEANTLQRCRFRNSCSIHVVTESLAEERIKPLPFSGSSASAPSRS